jgi:hypothetical protein
VKIEIKATTTTKVLSATYVNECTASTTSEAPATLSVNGEKTDTVKGGRLLGRCTGGPFPNGDEALFGEVREIAVGANGKAKLLGAVSGGPHTFVSPIMRIDQEGEMFSQGCNYYLGGIKGTFSAAASPFSIAGTSKVALSKEEPGNNLCSKHTTVTYSLELLEAEGEESALQTELVK